MNTILILVLACVTRDAFPEAYGAANCDVIERCGFDWSPMDEANDTCEEWFYNEAYLTGGIDYYFDADGWDAGLAAACVEETRDQDCDDPQPLPACDDLRGL